MIPSANYIKDDGQEIYLNEDLICTAIRNSSSDDSDDEFITVCMANGNILSVKALESNKDSEK